MRVDLTQDGNKDVDVELNGTKIENVLWADDAMGECEVFETDWRTGELVKAPDTEWGYRTMRLKGKVKINDRRPKAPAGDTIYDFQYPGICCIWVTPNSGGSIVSVRTADAGLLIKGFCVRTDLAEAVHVLYDRCNVKSVFIELAGIGQAVFTDLQSRLNCLVHGI
jgi:hypothetical protein